MKSKWLTLTVLILTFLVFAQAGCEKQGTMVTEPKASVTEAEPVAGSPSPKPDEEPSQTSATAAEETKPPSPSAPPRIRFEKVVHDFGEVSPGSINAAEFNFTNAGGAVLKIGNIKSTCGCTVPRLAKKEYAPGESGTIKIAYRAGRQPGSATRRLYVPSNDKAKPKVQLTVKARVAKKIDYQPNNLRLSLKRENAGCPEITVTSLDNQQFAVKSFESPGNSITASFDPLEKAQKHVLQPKVDVEKLKKSKRGNVKIGLTHPGCNLVTVRYQVVPEFKASPSSIRVRNAQPQKPIKKEILILSNFGESVDVESAASKEGFIKVLNQEKGATRYLFELEITPPDSGGSRTFTDVFYVNIKGGEKLEINCRGSYADNKKGR